MSNRVLFVGYDREEVGRAARVLELNGFPTTFCSTAEEALAELGLVEVIIVDASQSAKLVEVADNPAIELVLSGAPDAAAVAQASTDIDYLAAIDNPETVLMRVRRALRHRDLRLALSERQRDAARSGSFGDLIGSSPRMLETFDLIDRAASTNASVLITGESGTGKELVAHELHRCSKRASKRFVAINCSALPEALLESELFGHVKGAFTDARTTRPGLFVSAEGGTLFLDEIGDMPIGLQPKLLRALQERTIRAVGADGETVVDVRVIASTNVDLENAVHTKAFREDLYYRLNVVSLEVPPLRERLSDVLPLATHFVKKYSAAFDRSIEGIEARARDQLLAYSWPGNVRELENCIESAVTLARNAAIELVDLPPKIRNHRRAHPLVVSHEPEELISLADLEHQYIVQVVTTLGGNKKEAARVLGIDRKTLYRKLQGTGL